MQAPRGQGQGRIPKVEDITDLVGAHPGAVASFFEHAPPTDPDERGSAPQGLLLTFAGVEPVYFALRPLLRGLSRGTSVVWQGITFDHGGNGGTNRFFGNRSFGKGTMRFRAERGDSKLDGRPALVLTYEKSPWPISKVRDELRTIGPQIAVCASFSGDDLVGWFGFSGR